MLVGARATIRASGRRARGKASGWRLPGFWCGPGFWWFLARSGRCLARSAWRVTRCGLVCRSVRAPPYAPADGARAVGLLAGVCPASDADRASGGFWRVLGGLARYGRDRGGPGFARRMSRLIRSQAVSPGNGHARSGTGVSCGAARRAADDTSEAKRMIPRAPARGISSEAKPDQKRRAQDQSGASCYDGAGAVRVSCATALVRSVRLCAANDTSAQRRAAHQRSTRGIAGTGGRSPVRVGGRRYRRYRRYG